MSGADVSVWRDLVILSSDGQTRTTDESEDPAACEGNHVVADRRPLNSPDSFSGLRIVSIADPANPFLIKNVKKDEPFMGSHTHTLVPDLGHRDKETGRSKPRLIVYLNAPLGGQQVVEVPLRDPASARVVGEVDTSPAAGCHDVTVLVEHKLAACAAASETQLWDIADPEQPRVLSHIANPEIEEHHSTAFSWDGKTLVLGDESISALSLQKCYDGIADPKRGRLWFYDISDRSKPVEKSSFQIPAGRAPGACFAHQFNVVPMSGEQDVVVASWITGGTTVIDFTDPAKPEEIGFYVAEPNTAERRSQAFASYWYNGYIYVNNNRVPPAAVRGFDVLSLKPALPNLVRQQRMNAQTQEPLE